MKKFLILIVLIKCLSAYNQSGPLRTYYGDYMYPIDTIRFLNIFINIV